MIDRIRNRLTYANVTATFALFIALGGSSYAALSLPRNSVGPAQIRRSAVNSRHIRNGAVHLGDIATSTRRALRGNTGSAGPHGPPAAKFLALMGPDAGLVSGNCP